ncbi:hypothetical protein HPP92_022620 [Vanilla planifolia]|uniref:Uncharacterized protein n=1 Tax=Vanilla planifolia TaxID=51239 RepID=A0A835UDQ2_VANPL|nr:hypothetical protein HPP92_022620 [Vanilla planifolia]
MSSDTVTKCHMGAARLAATRRTILSSASVPHWPSSLPRGQNPQRLTWSPATRPKKSGAAVLPRAQKKGSDTDPRAAANLEETAVGADSSSSSARAVDLIPTDQANRYPEISSATSFGL